MKTFKLTKEDFDTAVPNDCKNCVFAQALKREGHEKEVKEHGVYPHDKYEEISFSYTSVLFKNVKPAGVKCSGFKIEPGPSAFILASTFDDHRFDDEESLKIAKNTLYEKFKDAEWSLEKT